jgi:hypothetical protein
MAAPCSTLAHDAGQGTGPSRPYFTCRMFTCDTGGSLTSVLHLYHYRVRCSCGCGALLLIQKLAVQKLSLACLRGAWPNIGMHFRTFATGKVRAQRQ